MGVPNTEPLPSRIIEPSGRVRDRWPALLTLRGSENLNYERLLGGGCLFVCDTVSALYKSVLKLPCCDCVELDVVVERPEERHAGADQDRNSSNNQFVDEACVQKPLDGLTSVNIKVCRTLGCQPLNEVLWR